VHRTLSVLFVVLALTWVFHAPAHALRCGGQIIHIGDSCDRVRDLCGQPTAVGRRQAAVAVEDPVVGWCYGPEPDLIWSDVWTYDFGRYRVRYELIFQDDRLWRIETGGYPR